MTTKNLLVLKKLALPSAILYTILLTILSLIKVRNIPEFGTNYDDKLYHIIAYVVLTLVWYFAIHYENFNKKIVYLVISCIAFGIIIEALQGKLTTHRVGDILDVVANVIGVLLALTYIILRKKRLS